MPSTVQRCSSDLIAIGAMRLMMLSYKKKMMDDGLEGEALSTALEQICDAFGIDGGCCRRELFNYETVREMDERNTLPDKKQ